MFRASSRTSAVAYGQAKDAALNLKQQVAYVIDVMSANDTTYSAIASYYGILNRAHNQLTTIAQTAGIAAFAIEQEDDPLYDLVVEFQAMLGAITAAKDWMTANLPLSVTLNPVDQWDVEMVSGSFSPAQTNGFRILLQAIVDTID